MTANVETIRIDTVRIETRTHPDWAHYLRAPTTAVRQWGERGQLGAPPERDIGRATGGRC